MKKIYVVVQDYSVEFCGVFSTWEKAWECAKEEGGSIVEYELGTDGEWHNVDGEP